VFIPLPFYSPMDAVPGLEINALMDYIFKFFLSSIRLSAFLISSPFLGSRNIPLNVKIIFSMVISFFYFGYISEIEFSISEIENLFIIIIIEAIIGIALGLTLSIWFSAATLAGEKMASSTGLGFSQMVDPETGGQTPVVSMILDLFLITVFLSLNGHLIAIDFLIKSFDIYKISTELPPLSLVALGIEATGAMFYTGGLIMLPVVGALLMTNIAIGVITRSSPQLNMFSFAFPVTLLLAFFVLYLSTRTIGNAFAELTKNSLESIEILFLGR
jgi:flagellar biosynthetic protein FliR